MIRRLISLFCFMICSVVITSHAASSGSSGRAATRVQRRLASLRPIPHRLLLQLWSSESDKTTEPVTDYSMIGYGRILRTTPSKSVVVFEGHPK